MLFRSPAGAVSDHPDIAPGEVCKTGRGFLLNALNSMLGVPLSPTYRDGKICNFDFDKKHFFFDVAGMERWLAVRPARNS